MCRLHVPQRKICLAETGQGSAVDFGVAADKVVDAGIERLAVAGILPLLRRLVAGFIKNSPGFPVLRFLGKIVSPFDEQNLGPAVA
jgi:hypothetical protein